MSNPEFNVILNEETKNVEISIGNEKISLTAEKAMCFSEVISSVAMSAELEIFWD